MNIFKTFRKDLSIAIDNNIKNPNKRNLIFFGLSIISYIYIYPMYLYYLDYKKRLNKLEKLKKDGLLLITE